MRIGPGSGSSPTLMGTAKHDDKLVVDTDGRKVMHLVAMWRDDIPKDWKPIRPGADRRIACDVPVNFGDPGIARAQSEQSVAVRGYAAVVVNNSLKDTSSFDGLPGSLRYEAAALNSGDPANQAHGVERIDWNPRPAPARSCGSTRPSRSPTRSRRSRGEQHGLRDRRPQRRLGLEGLSMKTGKSVLRYDTGAEGSTTRSTPTPRSPPTAPSGPARSAASTSCGRPARTVAAAELTRTPPGSAPPPWRRGRTRTPMPTPGSMGAMRARADRRAGRRSVRGGHRNDRGPRRMWRSRWWRLDADRPRGGCHGARHDHHDPAHGLGPGEVQDRPGAHDPRPGYDACRIHL